MGDMESIQRVLFVAPKVHIYAVPPLTSNSGYKAGDWKVDQEKSRIFTARVRIIETATENSSGEEKVRTDVRLEDPKTGDLFANCPYEVCFFYLFLSRFLSWPPISHSAAVN